MKKHSETSGKSSEGMKKWIGFLGGGWIFLKNSPLLGEMVQFDYIYMYIIYICNIYDQMRDTTN